MALLQNTSNFEYFATEHFRMSGVYWGLTALYLVGHLEDMDEEAIIKWVLESQHADGGFGLRGNGAPRSRSSKDARSGAPSVKDQAPRNGLQCRRGGSF